MDQKWGGALQIKRERKTNRQRNETIEHEDSTSHPVHFQSTPSSTSAQVGTTKHMPWQTTSLDFALPCLGLSVTGEAARLAVDVGFKEALVA